MNNMDALKAALAPSRVVLEADEETRQRLASIVEFSDDAIVSKDLNGIIMSWNKAPSACSAIPPTRCSENPSRCSSLRTIATKSREF